MPDRSPVETWKPVPGWDDYYIVSDLGQVRSLDRPAVTHLGGRYTRRGQLLKPTEWANGYLMVGLYAPGKQIDMGVHRLVLLAHVGEPPDDKPFACHIDGIKRNNQLDNLRWDDQSANIHDSVDHMTHRNTRKEACKRNHAFVGPNLIETFNVDKSGRKNPARQCRACTRASWQISAMRRRGDLAVADEAKRQQLADEAYADIMAGYFAAAIPAQRSGSEAPLTV